MNCFFLKQIERIDFVYFFSRRWKREQQKAEIMRGFPPTYLNGPATAAAANPHMAATYMANLNKAAAYAAAVSAAANSMPRHYAYNQAASHEDLTAEGRMRVQPPPQQQTKDPYGHNIYAVSFSKSSLDGVRLDFLPCDTLNGKQISDHCK